MKNLKTIRFIVATLIGMVFSLPGIGTVSSASAGDVKIICNKDVSVASLSKKDIKNIFLGKKTLWESGAKIRFVTLKKGDLNTSFLKTYVGKTDSQYTRFWKKMVFTGKGKAPKAFESEDELIDYVANTEGATGYISSGKQTDKVKTISVN